jgi:two-component system, LuxR family, response regulator FixJ
MGQNNKVLVLVVEDDLAVRSSLAFSLEIEGFKVRSYATGEELLNAGSLDGCDCFIIDQKLPGLSGLDLIARLRDRHVDAPAILITSNPSASLCRQAEHARVPIVEKPLLGNVLLDRIHDMLDNVRH